MPILTAEQIQQIPGIKWNGNYGVNAQGKTFFPGQGENFTSLAELSGMGESLGDAAKRISEAPGGAMYNPGMTEAQIRAMPNVTWDAAAGHGVTNATGTRPGQTGGDWLVPGSIYADQPAARNYALMQSDQANLAAGARRQANGIGGKFANLVTAGVNALALPAIGSAYSPTIAGMTGFSPEGGMTGMNAGSVVGGEAGAADAAYTMPMGGGAMLTYGPAADAAAAEAGGAGGLFGLGGNLTLGNALGLGSLAMGAAGLIGGKASPPSYNPAANTAAQTASNKDTALYQSGLNNVNQITPYGSQTFSYVPGVNGGPPQITSSSVLSPAQQALLDNQQRLQMAQQGIASGALDQARLNMQNPFNLGGLQHQLASASDISNAEAAGTQKVIGLMQPQMTINDNLFMSQLANQGIMPGSEAYNNALLQHRIANNAAYSQAALAGVQAGQALQQEALSNNQQDVANYAQQYFAPINAYQAMQNGVQVQNPVFAPPQGNVVSPVNTLQAAQNAYQSQLNAYSANTASANSTATGLFGLGGSFLNGTASGKNLLNTSLFGQG